MRIKMLTSVSGDGFSHAPGEEGTGIPEGERQNYIDAGYAEEIAEPKKTSAKKGK
tara:strand:+ start:1591 stop:1755 length:165 start_codon:yes stop_codon:yes gene_type:complete